MSTTVSVIVPNYNHSKFLKQRIDSILSQTYDDFELILLDDCSTDDSRDVLLSYKDNNHVTHIVINDTNTGSPFQQWAKGINLARGKYIWIAESDDYADPDFLKITTSELDKHPEANICLTGSHVVNENNEPVDDQYKHVDLWETDDKPHVFDSKEYIIKHMSLHNNVYNGSMVLFRKEGCLDDMPDNFFKMRYAGDWLFWIQQIKKNQKIIEIHSKLNYWRKHTSNTTLEGFENFNSLPEVAYIKDYLFKTTLSNKPFDILIVKSSLYRLVKHMPNLTSERRTELLDLLKNQYNIKKIHSTIGHWLRGLRKLTRSLSKTKHNK